MDRVPLEAFLARADQGPLLEALPPEHFRWREEDRAREMATRLLRGPPAGAVCFGRPGSFHAPLEEIPARLLSHLSVLDLGLGHAARRRWIGPCSLRAFREGRQGGYKTWEEYFDVHVAAAAKAHGRPPRAFPRAKVRDALLAEATARGRPLGSSEVDSVAASQSVSRSETRKLWKTLRCNSPGLPAKVLPFAARR